MGMLVFEGDNGKKTIAAIHSIHFGMQYKHFR